MVRIRTRQEAMVKKKQKKREGTAANSRVLPNLPPALRRTRPRRKSQAQTRREAEQTEEQPAEQTEEQEQPMGQTAPQQQYLYEAESDKTLVWSPAAPESP